MTSPMTLASLKAGTTIQTPGQAFDADTSHKYTRLSQSASGARQRDQVHDDSDQRPAQQGDHRAGRQASGRVSSSVEATVALTQPIE